MRCRTTTSFLSLAAAFWALSAPAQEAAKKEVSRPTLASLPPGAISAGNTFVVAAYGESYLFNLKAGIERLPFLEGVYRPFGFSADSRYFLYLKAQGRTPTFSLYQYDLANGSERLVTEERVYNAAWSPTSLDIAIMTLDAADRYGLSVGEVRPGSMRKAGAGLLDPDYIEWSPDGKRVLFSKLNPLTENYFHDGEFERILYEYDFGLDKTAEVGKGTLARHGVDGQRRYIEVEAGAAAKLKGGTVNAAMSRGALYIESAEGRGLVKRWDEEKSAYETAGEGRIYAATDDGVVIRDLAPGGVVFKFASSQPLKEVYAFTNSWKLPFEGTADLNQGGALYSGGSCDGRSCNIVSHNNALGYALDWQQRPNQNMGPARILAPEEGTVAVVVTNVTCNSLNTTCQIGWDNYSPTCANPGGAGNHVVLAHPDGSYSFYGHMRSGTSPLTVGQVVGQGAYLGDQGHSGSTGQNFGNYQGCGDHIHFQRQMSVAVWAQSIPTDFVELPCSLSCRTNYASQNSDTSVPASVTALTVKLTPQTIAPGATSPANRVILPAAAAAPGLAVALSSSSTDVTVPASVTVPTGATHAQFPITVSATAAPGGVTITAQEGSQNANATLTVKTVAVYSLTLSSGSIVGGNSSSNHEVVLTDATAAGATVGLSSSNAVATTPGSLSIPSGGTYGTFAIGTTTVASTTNSSITATYGGVNRSATLTVNPLTLNSVSASPASVVGGVSSTGTVVMNGKVPVSPISVTLSSSDPAASVPASVTVNAGATQVTFPITTSAVLTATPVTITAVYNGVTRTATLTVNTVKLSSVTLGAPSVIGGGTVSGSKANLNGPAGPGDITVLLASSNPAVASVPANRVVLAGTTQSPGFPITTTAVSVATVVTITASYGGIDKTANLTVNPVTPSSVALSSSTAAGGVVITGNRVNLNAAAGAGGAVITLLSSDPAVASVAANVTAAAGSTQSAAFPITTTAVSTNTVVTITAAYNGVSRMANLTLTPTALSSVTLGAGAAVGGATVNGSYVRLTGPADASGVTVGLVSSNPAVAAVPTSVTVAGGATQSPNFSITTTAVSTPTVVTITASYSGVNKTANLTVNPTALSAVTLTSTSVVGATDFTGNRVVLTGPAGPGDVIVTLASSNPALAAVPATMTVAAGSTQSPTFTVDTSSVTVAETVTITASYNGVSKTANVAVNPVKLSSLALTSGGIITGGLTLTGNRANLNGPAGPGDLEVLLSSSNPAVASVPASRLVPAGATQSQPFPITTSAVSVVTVVTITASYNGISKTANVTVNPVALTSVSLGSGSVVGGVTIQNTKVNLNAPAGPGPIVVSLSTSDPSLATVAPSVTIPVGATQSPAFPITTYYTPSATTVNLIATYGGVTKTPNITLNPPAVLSVTLSPASVVGGGTTANNKINFTGPAGPGGAEVQLASSNPAVAAVPASVTVAAGSSMSPVFSITTTSVAASTPVTVTATYNGVSKTATLTVNP